MPGSSQLGSTFFNQSVLEEKVQRKIQEEDIKEHLLTLYNVFREELVILIERVRFLYLENIGGLSRIARLPDWGEVRPALKALHNNLTGHIDTETTPDKIGWATKIKKMKDNTLRKQLEKLAFETVETTLAFSFASYEGVNETLGVGFGSERDLEKKIHGMYSDILNIAYPQVSIGSVDCVCFFNLFSLSLYIGRYSGY